MLKKRNVVGEKLYIDIYLEINKTMWYNILVKGWLYDKLRIR